MSDFFKYELILTTVADAKNLESHFADMAQRGWMIDKAGMFTFRYRNIEPQDLCFFVDYLPEVTTYDHPDNDSAIEHRRQCEELGWTFAAAHKQYQFFYHEAGSPPAKPIHADNQTEARVFLKAFRKNELLIIIVQFLLCIFIFGLCVLFGAELFLMNTAPFLLLGVSILILTNFWAVISKLRWYLRTWKAARHNLPVPTGNQSLTRMRNAAAWLGACLLYICTITGLILDLGSGVFWTVIYFLVFAGMLAIGLWLRRRILTEKRTHSDNKTMCYAAAFVMAIVSLIVFVISTPGGPRSHDSLGGRPAITLDSLGVESTPSFTFLEVRGSVAVPVNFRYWESHNDVFIRQTVRRSVSDRLSLALFDHFVEEMEYWHYVILSRAERGYEIVSLSTEESALWGADKGRAVFYNEHHVNLVLLRGRSILFLYFDIYGIDMETLRHAVIELFYALE